MGKFFDSIRKIFAGKPDKNVLTDSDLAKLKKQYQKFMDEVNAESSIQDKVNKEDKGKHDGICPKCKSANINDRIKRFQGDINGRSSGNGWSVLGFGENQSSGYIKGKFDTSEVNKCNDCENEWKKWDGNLYTSRSDMIEKRLRSLRFAMLNFQNSKTVTWDKFDLKEKFESLEAKQKDAIEKMKNDVWVGYAKKDWANYSIELVEKLFEERGGYDLRKWKESYDYNFLRERIGLRHINEF
jgi:hypothetical protein